MRTTERVVPRLLPTARRRSAVLLVAGLVATLLAAAPASATSADELPWHAQGRVLADPTTGPTLPDGLFQDIRMLTGSDDLAVSSHRGVWRLRLAQTGGVRSHQVEPITLVEEASGGAGANWQARVHDDGRVIAVVCPDDPPAPCTLRIRDTAGTWTTLAGGGERWLEPSADPTLTSWSHLPQLPGTANYVGVDPLDLGLVLPTEMMIDPVGDRVFLDQRGFVASLWSIDLTTGAVARVARPDPSAVPPVDGVVGYVSSLGLLPDGRLLVSPDVYGVNQVVVDLDTDVATETGIPSAGAVAVVDDGTVWTRENGLVSRRTLDGEVLEWFSGDDLGRVGLGVVTDFVMVDHPDGLLTYGRERRLAWQCCHAPVVELDMRALLLQSGPTVADPPASVSAVAGDSRATVTWSEAYGYGRAVSGYTVTASPGGRSVTVGGTVRSATLTGLSNATAHRFTVRAVNEVGTGAPSAASAPVTPRDVTPPGPVVLGTTTAGNGYAQLRWSPPTTADYAGVTVVRRSGAVAPRHPADGTVVYRGAATTLKASGLTPGTGYAFAVFARDAVGNHSAGRSTSVAGVRMTLSTTSYTGAAVGTIAYGTRDATLHTVRLTDTNLDPVPGRRVSLQIRTRGATAWSTLYSKTTSTTGEAIWEHRPARSSEYRVVANGAGLVTGNVSPTRTLQVRTAVGSAVSASSVRRGTSVSISGTVKPAHPYSVVRLERRTSTGWAKVADRKMTSGSAYRFSVTHSTAGSVTYRVVMPGHTDHATGTSTARTIRWS